MRMHLLFHSYINLYALDKDKALILGEPLPSELNRVNYAGHHMTLDKIVATGTCEMING